MLSKLADKKVTSESIRIQEAADNVILDLSAALFTSRAALRRNVAGQPLLMQTSHHCGNASWFLVPVDTPARQKLQVQASITFVIRTQRLRNPVQMEIGHQLIVRQSDIACFEKLYC